MKILSFLCYISDKCAVMTKSVSETSVTSSDHTTTVYQPFWTAKSLALSKFMFMVDFIVHKAPNNAVIVVIRCLANGCTNQEGKTKRGKKRPAFYRFPAQPKRQIKYVLDLKHENWQPIKKNKTRKTNIKKPQQDM